MSFPGSFFKWLLTGLRTIPSLVQVSVVEILATGLIGGGVVARVLDHYGLCGHPPIAELNAYILVWLAVGLLFMWLTLAPMLRPAFQDVSWSPPRHFGPVVVVFNHDPSSVRYKFLDSHPALILMDLFAGLIPAAITVYSWGDDPIRNPLQHVYHWWLIVWALVPLTRLFCWYILRRGPEIVTALTRGQSETERRDFEWRMFWHGPLVFWTFVLLLAGPALYLGSIRDRNYDASIPALSAAKLKMVRGDAASPSDERYRVTGTLRGGLKLFPGGNGKFPGAGFILKLADGTDVLVFVETDNLKAVQVLTEKPDGAPVTCLVRLLDKGGSVISEHYLKYYNWNAADFSTDLTAPDSPRVLVRYVDP